MPAWLAGVACSQCSRPGHNPPARYGDLCVDCWRKATPAERVVALEQEQVAADLFAATRNEIASLPEIER